MTARNCTLGFILVLGLFALANRVDANSCEEGHAYLGLKLDPQKQKGQDGLAISEITQLTPGSRVGLKKGDIVEQINSWTVQDCNNYSEAIRDAETKKKAILLLVSRKGKRRPIFFEPEIWQRIQEKKEEKQAVSNLRAMLTAPLPKKIQESTEAIGDQALATLRQLEPLAILTHPLPAYEKGVELARNRLRVLSRQSQGEAEKRVVAGARALFGYYEAARAIRQYKLEYIEKERKDIRQARAQSFVSETVPYFYDSPVTAWVDKYPFLRSSITDSPDKLGFDFIEKPGAWNPDRAVQLLWQQAKGQTNRFSEWIKGMDRREK